MASVMGLLEERETAARAAVEELQAEADRILTDLGVSEAVSERRVIARVELAEALAAGDDAADPPRLEVQVPAPPTHVDRVPGPVHATSVGCACRGELSGLLTAVVRARRRAMSMLAEIEMNASLEAGSASKSRTRRRERISHPRLRSTTQRLGSTTNPVMSSLRLTICRMGWSFSFTQVTMRPV
ncbi:hypothetical protein [Streptomyces adelaidensis]|uniref:hypothetical protein n=1 Tax=Streptomyces adelaidensis TaxID=2796465 RepID=UPI003556A101